MASSSPRALGVTLTPLACVLALSACPRVADLGGDALGPVCDESLPGPWGGLQLAGGTSVDFLFVIDNSGSMAPHQVKLNAGIDELFERLDDAGVDFRMGFTTTDSGNPWCPAGTTTPEHGTLVLSPCEERLGDFVFNGGEVDTRDLACTSQCDLDAAALAITPTITYSDSNEIARPWLQRIGGQTNLPADTPIADAFKCFAPQGINGCGFESQLESMHLALARSQDQSGDAYGFIGDDAMLAVVILTDEADCSTNQDWSEIFEQDGNRVFWEDPSTSFPSSAVCWNAGVECLGDPSAYDSCEPVDRDVDGNLAADPSDAVLHPLDRYRGMLTGLLEQKWQYNSGQELLLTLIAGVEGGGGGASEDWSVTYADSPDPDTQLAWGIAPGCTDADGNIAVPPVRMRALAEEFPTVGLYSTCAPDYGEAMAALGQSILDSMEPKCYWRCVADSDRSTPQLEPKCDVSRYSLEAGGVVPVPPCARGADSTYFFDEATGSYQVPEGEDVCYVALVDPDGTQTRDAHDQLSPECVDVGANVEFVIERRPGVSTGPWIDADCTLSDCDCL